MTIATQQKHALPYFEDSSKLFAPLADKEWSIFLDSGFPYSHHGRYDFIVTDPKITLVTEGNTTKIESSDTINYSDKDPFVLVKQYLNQSLPALEGIPFNGGAMGYFSYDLARRLEKLPCLAKDEENLPEMAIGIYDWAVIVDHDEQQSWLIGSNIDNEEWLGLIDQFSFLVTECQQNKFSISSQPQSNMDKDSYQKAFETIKQYLIEGDSYQVHIAQRFASQCSGSAWPAYQRLREVNSAPFSAYLNFKKLQILSSSPERFLKVTNQEVESKPIKGTRPKLKHKSEDDQQIAELLQSHKDRAENVMIVDLLRNDISKNCQEGSVKVPKLFEVESFATVHHLASSVTGMLAKGEHALDLLRSCFPGGSITGAPKIRAMEIIEELEPNRRGIYCGAIGYIGFDGNMDTNIAIRTLVKSDGIIRFWAGGGIVNDSVLEDEYQESFDKAAALLNLLVEFKSNESH
jgi:para-aminobenzoate synthetase component 1